VMQVGIMRVLVDETAVLGRMAVRVALRIGRRMRVPMMRVVDVPVLVKERLVHMLVLVFFGKVQIHAGRHEPGSADQGPCDRLADQRNRDRSAEKGSGRKKRSGAGRTEVAQPQYEERQTNAITEETDDSGRGKGPLSKSPRRRVLPRTAVKVLLPHSQKGEPRSCNMRNMAMLVSGSFLSSTLASRRAL